MMTNNQDQLLQSVFAEARQDLNDEALTSSIVSRTRNFSWLLKTGAISIAILLLAATWLVFGMPLLEFALLISQLLALELFELGEGWLGLALMPVNNIASLLVISAKAIHLAWKKLIGSSFAH